MGGGGEGGVKELLRFQVMPAPFAHGTHMSRVMASSQLHLTAVVQASTAWPALRLRGSGGFSPMRAQANAFPAATSPPLPAAGADAAAVESNLRAAPGWLSSGAIPHVS